MFFSFHRSLFYIGLLGGGIMSLTGIYYYLKNKNKDYSHIRTLIDGNKRFVSKKKCLIKPDCQDLLIVNLNNTLNTKNIFDITCSNLFVPFPYNSYSSHYIFEVLEILKEKKIKTMVVIDEKNYAPFCKDYLNKLKSNELIKKTLQENNVKDYWASYDETNGHVIFHHLFEG